ncbi:MAG: hypothetical protein ACRENG_36510 [bacterium]
MSEWLNWRSAFLRQARSDWEAYQKIAEFEWPICHQLHYLQMATEKLSKALLIADDTELESMMGSHAAFVKFFRVIANNRKLQKALGMNKSQQRARFKTLFPLAHEVELLAPALAQHGPNPEYPWKDASRNILAPADYSFPLLKRLQQSPQGTQLLKYVEIFLKRFEELFM